MFSLDDLCDETKSWALLEMAGRPVLMDPAEYAAMERPGGWANEVWAAEEQYRPQAALLDEFGRPPRPEAPAEWGNEYRWVWHPRDQRWVKASRRFNFAPDLDTFLASERGARPDPEALAWRPDPRGRRRQPRTSPFPRSPTLSPRRIEEVLAAERRQTRRRSRSRSRSRSRGRAYSRRSRSRSPARRSRSRGRTQRRLRVFDERTRTYRSVTPSRSPRGTRRSGSRPRRR